MVWVHGKPLLNKPVVILGQGPSLTEQSVEKLENAGFTIIAIKDSSRYVRNPWLIYACDRKWWIRRWADWRYEYLRQYQGIKLVMNWQKIKDDIPNLQTLNYDGMFGLSFRESFVRHGRNSGYQMINHTINLGANPIILHGFDMQIVDGKTHGVPEHVPIGKGTFREFVNYFNTMEHDLRVWGGQIWNTCLTSALNDTLFPKLDIDTVIKEYGYART